MILENSFVPWENVVLLKTNVGRSPSAQIADNIYHCVRRSERFRFDTCYMSAILRDEDSTQLLSKNTLTSHRNNSTTVLTDRIRFELLGTGTVKVIQRIIAFCDGPS